jgi:hypothetical protein
VSVDRQASGSDQVREKSRGEKCERNGERVRYSFGVQERDLAYLAIHTNTILQILFPLGLNWNKFM